MSNARIRGRLKHTLSANNRTDVAPSARAAYLENPRPSDLPLHADGQRNRLFVRIKTRPIRSFCWHDSKPAKRQLVRARLGVGSDRQHPAGVMMREPVDPETLGRVPKAGNNALTISRQEKVHQLSPASGLPIAYWRTIVGSILETFAFTSAC